MNINISCPFQDLNIVFIMTLCHYDTWTVNNPPCDFTMIHGYVRVFLNDSRIWQQHIYKYLVGITQVSWISHGLTVSCFPIKLKLTAPSRLLNNTMHRWHDNSRTETNHQFDNYYVEWYLLVLQKIWLYLVDNYFICVSAFIRFRLSKQ
jgi:hypothetical protein